MTYGIYEPNMLRTQKRGEDLYRIRGVLRINIFPQNWQIFDMSDAYCDIYVDRIFHSPSRSAVLENDIPYIEGWAFHVLSQRWGLLFEYVIREWVELNIRLISEAEKMSRLGYPTLPGLEMEGAI